MTRVLLEQLTSKNIISQNLLGFYNSNSQVYPLIVKTFMTEFIIDIVLTGKFAKILIILLILL